MRKWLLLLRLTGVGSMLFLIISATVTHVFLGAERVNIGGSGSTLVALAGGMIASSGVGLTLKPTEAFRLWMSGSPTRFLRPSLFPALSAATCLGVALALSAASVVPAFKGWAYTLLLCSVSIGIAKDVLSGMSAATVLLLVTIVLQPPLECASGGLVEIAPGCWYSLDSSESRSGLTDGVLAAIVVTSTIWAFWRCSRWYGSD